MTTTTDAPTETDLEALEAELEEVEDRIAELEAEKPGGGDPSEIREDAKRIREELADEKAVAEELRDRIERRRDAEGRARADAHRRELRDRAYTAGADALAGAQRIESRREELVEAVEVTIEGLEDYTDLLREASLVEELWELAEVDDPELAEVGDLDLPDLAELEERFEETLREIRKLRDAASGRRGRRDTISRKIWSVTENPERLVNRAPYSRARGGWGHLTAETREVVRRPYVERLRALYRAVPENEKKLVTPPPDLD